MSSMIKIISLFLLQFFSEANEVELWMNEKADILESTDYGKDEDAAVKLLTKHKVSDSYLFVSCEMFASY